MKLNYRFSHMRLIQAAAIVTLFLFSTCKEDPLELGLDILPEDDLLEAKIDTLPVELFTISHIPLNTRSVGASPLGAVNDPVMGKIEADFITDYIYTESITYYDDSIHSPYIVDLTIELKFDSISNYGNADEEDVAFNVFELLEPVPDYAYSDYRL